MFQSGNNAYQEQSFVVPFDCVRLIEKVAAVHSEVFGSDLSGEDVQFRMIVWNLKGLALTSNNSCRQKAQEAFRVLADNNTAVFALTELGPEPDSILEDLANHLGSEWTPHFGAVRGVYSEVGLILNTQKLSATTIKLTTLPHVLETGDIIQLGRKPGRKPAAVFQISRNNKPSFLLAVVHFKAEGGQSEAYTRKCLASWLRLELENMLKILSLPDPLPVVIAGDFNGEPWEGMFGPEGFRAFRRADAALRSNGALKLYNPMWKLLPDPTTVAERRVNKLPAPPYGTFLNEIWHSLIDGAIVSSEWLESPHYILHDDRLEILTDALWHHIGKQGAHHAYSQDIEAENVKALAITDHLPVAITLEIK